MVKYATAGSICSIVTLTSLFRDSLNEAFFDSENSVRVIVDETVCVPVLDLLLLLVKAKDAVMVDVSLDVKVRVTCRLSVATGVSESDGMFEPLKVSDGDGVVEKDSVIDGLHVGDELEVALTLGVRVTKSDREMVKLEVMELVLDAMTDGEALRETDDVGEVVGVPVGV